MATKRHLGTLILPALCTFLLTAPEPVLGRTLYVDDVYVAAYESDMVPVRRDGLSWATAFEYLQDALAVASAGDEIRVAEGQYRPDQGTWVTLGDRRATFRLIDGVTILGGFAGPTAVDPNQRDISRFATILTGDLVGNDDPNDQSTLSDNSFHVVTAEGASSDTVLDGLRIAHGEADAGGGLRNIDASPIVRDCTFFRNRANEGGGGVMNTDSNAVFVGCTFLENWCDDGDGGGMDNRRSHIRIEDCRFIRNYANDDGGGLSSVDGSLEVINCEFLENRSSEIGGGVANARSRATFFNCVFRANRGAEGVGAISGGDRLILCKFVDNFGGEGVGAVACGDTVVVNCTFANNFGEGPGAILARRGYLSHCTFYGNVGWGEIGWADSGSAGALWGDAVTASGCIFWGNRNLHSDVTGYDAQLAGDPNTMTVEYCCIEGWTPERGGVGNIGADPLFVGVDQNDFHVKSQAGHWDAAALAWVADDVTSPCIDAGDPNSPVGQEPFPNGGRVNMGVYGGTCEASKSWFGTEAGPGVNAADLNGDGRVDDEDYRLALQRWPQADQ